MKGGLTGIVTVLSGKSQPPAGEPCWLRSSTVVTELVLTGALVPEIAVWNSGIPAQSTLANLAP
jgi:hypothetical protein